MEEGKIKYLFDSSAILDLIKLGEKALDRAIQGSGDSGLLCKL